MLESNKKEEHIKEYLTKEIDSIKVPKGLKEEIWTEINATRKKKVFHSKLLPYIAAIAVVALFIPLVLSLLPTSEMASDELAGKTFDVRGPGDPNISGDLTTIMTLEFSNENTFKNNRGNIEGTYELNGNKLLLLLENENEIAEIEFTLEESHIETSEYSAFFSDGIFRMKNSEQVSKYKDFYMTLPNYKVEFVRK